LGGLKWSDVRAAIERELSNLDNVTITVFEPSGTPDPAVLRNRKIPDMTSGRAALVGLIDRYLAGLLDPFVTLLEVHKLMYFMQEAGEPLRLRYVKAPYGPYAENLRHVLNAVEGHFVSGFSNGGEKPDKEIALVPGAVDDAIRFLKDHRDTQTRFERVGALVEGFESPFGLELLATVHWLVTHESIKEVDDIVRSAYAWNERKKQFSERQIRLAFDKLVRNGWISDAVGAHR
jgi:uncharacterized protein YwgA